MLTDLQLLSEVVINQRPRQMRLGRTWCRKDCHRQRRAKFTTLHIWTFMARGTVDATTPEDYSVDRARTAHGGAR